MFGGCLMRSRGLWFGSLLAAAATLWAITDLPLTRIAPQARADTPDRTPIPFNHASLARVAGPGSGGCIQTASASTFRPGNEVPDTYWPLSVFAANADNLNAAADTAQNSQRIQFILAANGSSIASTVERHFALIRSNHQMDGNLEMPDADGCAPL